MDAENVRRLINTVCQCGGAGPGEGCQWCDLYHHIDTLTAEKSKLMTLLQYNHPADCTECGYTMILASCKEQAKVIKVQSEHLKFLTAELEKVREEAALHDRTSDAHIAEQERLRDEVERLEETLRQIAEDDSDMGEWYGMPNFGEENKCLRSLLRRVVSLVAELPATEENYMLYQDIKHILGEE